MLGTMCNCAQQILAQFHFTFTLAFTLTFTLTFTWNFITTKKPSELGTTRAGAGSTTPPRTRPSRPTPATPGGSLLPPWLFSSGSTLSTGDSHKLAASTQFCLSLLSFSAPTFDLLARYSILFCKASYISISDMILTILFHQIIPKYDNILYV